MRHLLLAGTMLVAALVVTFATASVLQGVAVAQDNSVQGEQFEVTEIVTPAMKPPSPNKRVTSLWQN